LARNEEDTVTVTDEPTYDVGTLARRLDRHRADEERRRNEALARGGPCRYCGTQESWEWPSPEVEGQTRDPRPALPAHAVHGAVGRWYEGDVCSWCHVERRSDPDADHRDRVIRGLLGDVTRFWYPRYLIQRTGFRWFFEADDAEPGGPHRFAYVDAAGLRARLAPPDPAPTEFEIGDPCPRCGVADRWVTQEVVSNRGRPTVARGPRGEIVDVRPPEVETERVCYACRLVPRSRNPGRDLREHVARYVGLHVPIALDGVSWYEDSGLTEPAASPFDWWEPVEVLRARAYAQRPNPRDWVGTRAWEHARDSAATPAA
jgi:hypothetical protein